MPCVGSEDGESDSQEIPAFDPSHMTFVDNRCTCCPYGYHVDLDFLHCLDERQKAGYVLGNLRRALNNKRQLRRSMEVFMHQVCGFVASGFDTVKKFSLAHIQPFSHTCRSTMSVCMEDNFVLDTFGVYKRTKHFL